MQGGYPNSAVRRANCFRDAENTHELPYINDPDILGLIQAKRFDLAVQVDNGQLSQEQAALQLAELRAQTRQVELDRHNAAIAASAQQSAASAQMLGAAARLLQGNQQPPIVNTTCNRLGYTVNCTSN